MDTPKIEIKNLKTAEFASDETLCFQCTVYVNGEKAFTASNDGKGSEDMYHLFDKDLYKLANDYAKTLPPYEGFDNIDIPCDLDLLIADLIETERNKKWLKRNCKGKILFRLPDDKKGQYRVISKEYTPEIAKYILGKYPTAEIANEQIL
jgi:hypothetical protein